MTHAHTETPIYKLDKLYTKLFDLYCYYFIVIIIIIIIIAVAVVVVIESNVQL